jgi:hypothetical protein
VASTNLVGLRALYANNFPESPAMLKPTTSSQRFSGTLGAMHVSSSELAYTYALLCATYQSFDHSSVRIAAQSLVNTWS